MFSSSIREDFFVALAFDFVGDIVVVRVFIQNDVVEYVGIDAGVRFIDCVIRLVVSAILKVVVCIFIIGFTSFMHRITNHKHAVIR